MTFSADELEDGARAATGLHDFGSPYYREGLERTVDALNNEAELSEIGNVIQHATISNALIQRLKVEDSGHAPWPETGYRYVMKNAPEYLRRMAGDFARRVKAYSEKHKIPLQYCQMGQRNKYEKAEKARPRDPHFQGIFLSPQQAKALANVLNQNVQQYESAFGEIKLDPQMVPGGSVN